MGTCSQKAPNKEFGVPLQAQNFELDGVNQRMEKGSSGNVAVKDHDVLKSQRSHVRPFTPKPRRRVLPACPNSRNKQALRLALAYRLREELNAELFSSPSLEQAYRRYLRYAETNPHEYELLRMSWGQLFAPGSPRPGRAWLLTQLAARFGGEPEEYARAFDAFFLLCHGTATLLAVSDDQAMREAIRDNCIQVCDKLIANVAILRAQE